jgi:hypothetical protein
VPPSLYRLDVVPDNERQPVVVSDQVAIDRGDATGGERVSVSGVSVRGVVQDHASLGTCLRASNR